MCQLIGHPWELRLDRHKGIVHCPRCEESASLFGGRFVRHQIDALLATLQVRPDANECSGHERGSASTATTGQVIEPPRLAALVPETSASTNFAT